MLLADSIIPNWIAHRECRKTWQLEKYGEFQKVSLDTLRCTQHQSWIHTILIRGVSIKTLHTKTLLASKSTWLSRPHKSGIFGCLTGIPSPTRYIMVPFQNCAVIFGASPISVSLRGATSSVRKLQLYVSNYSIIGTRRFTRFCTVPQRCLCPLAIDQRHRSRCAENISITWRHWFAAASVWWERNMWCMFLWRAWMQIHVIGFVISIAWII